MVLSRYVGAVVKRKEDPRLITGSSTYVDDLKIPGALHVAFVRSQYPHALVNGVNASDALAMPGVVAVLTADDLKKVMTGQFPQPRSEAPVDNDESDIPKPDVLPLADGKVRYIGDPIAAVVAETLAQAIDAAQYVMVDYEPLQAVIDPTEAMQPGAPQLYADVRNNISVVEKTLVGDADAADETDDVVDDEDLAVGAMVGLAQLLAFDGPKPLHPRTSVLHRLHEFVADAAGAQAVEQDANGDPAFGGLAERLGESSADVARPVDEGEEVDGLLG